MSGDPLRTLLRRFVTADERKDDLERQLKIAKREATELEQRVWDHLDDTGQDYGIWDLGEGFGRVAFTKQETVRATVSHAATARKSLEEAGLATVMFDAMGKLRQKALNDEVRDWKRTGRRFLDGINFHSTRYVTITRKPERKD